MLFKCSHTVEENNGNWEEPHAPGSQVLKTCIDLIQAKPRLPDSKKEQHLKSDFKSSEITACSTLVV